MLTSETEFDPGRRRVTDYGLAVGAILLTTAIGFVIRSHVLVTDVAMLYLLAVVFVATRTRSGPAVVASILSTALLDFVFVPPYYTFTVADIHYFLTFAVMVVVALTMTRLTARLREQATEAQAAERRVSAVAAMDRDIADAPDRESLLARATSHLANAVNGEAAIVLAEETGNPDDLPVWPVDGVFASVEVRVAATFAFQWGKSAGIGTGNCASAEALAAPVQLGPRRLGVVVVRPGTKAPAIRPDERRTVEALADALALALGRSAFIITSRHRA